MDCPWAEEKLQLFFLIFDIFCHFKWLILVQTTHLSCSTSFLFSFSSASMLLCPSCCISLCVSVVDISYFRLPSIYSQNLLIKTSEIAFEKPVCPTCSWPRDRQTLDINEILLLGIQLLNRVMQKLKYYFLLPGPLACPSACPL